MLDEQDLKRIGGVVERAVKGGEERVIQAVGEMIEQNITPVLDELHGQIDDVKKTIANLPDKAYLDVKIADLDGKVVVREKKLDQKVNLVVDALDEQRIVREDKIKTIRVIHVFPPAPLAQ